MEVNFSEEATIGSNLNNPTEQPGNNMMKVEVVIWKSLIMVGNLKTLIIKNKDANKI